VTVPTVFDPARTDSWHFLATTNRKLESVAIEEVANLVDAEATVAYPGVIQFTGDEAALARLHRCSRSLHRILLELARTECATLADVRAGVREIDVPAYLGPEQSFAVRARRRGEHPFGSPDVEREVGQVIVDEYRSREGTRPPVDLDDPDVLFRVIVRDERARVTIDTTGQRSLHRRWYRRCEHEAALRPTLAYAMLTIAGYEPGDRLVDPMCGCGTIPIEAALLARGRSPTPDCTPPSARFRFLDGDPAGPARTPPDHNQAGVCSCGDTPAAVPNTVGTDHDRTAVAGARENARAATIADQVLFAQGDARHLPVEGDVVVTDMPFGVRTGGALRPLYDGFFEAVERETWDRVVVLTAREDLAPEPDRSIPIRRGRMDASILVFE
jgi:tRNA (guanine6-N2)-methyltransferase